MRTGGGRPKIQELETLDGGILRRVLERGFGSLTLGAYGLSSTCTAICVEAITSSNGSTQPNRLKNILRFARATLTPASTTMNTSFFGAVLHVHFRQISVGSLEELRVPFLRLAMRYKEHNFSPIEVCSEQ